MENTLPKPLLVSHIGKVGHKKRMRTIHWKKARGKFGIPWIDRINARTKVGGFDYGGTMDVGTWLADYRIRFVSLFGLRVGLVGGRGSFVTCCPNAQQRAYAGVLKTCFFGRNGGNTSAKNRFFPGKPQLIL